MKKLREFTAYVLMLGAATFIYKLTDFETVVMVLLTMIVTDVSINNKVK